MTNSAGRYVSPDGAFDRDTRYLPTRITADGRDGFPVEPCRYRLVVGRACPWATRAVIVRRLHGLEPSGREALGGRPFGDGTPPGPPPEAERVRVDHTPLAGA